MQSLKNESFFLKVKFQISRLSGKNCYCPKFSRIQYFRRSDIEDLTFLTKLPSALDVPEETRL